MPFELGQNESYREGFERDMKARNLDWIDKDLDFARTTYKAGYFAHQQVEEMYIGWLIGHDFFGKNFEDVYP